MVDSASTILLVVWEESGLVINKEMRTNISLNTSILLAQPHMYVQKKRKYTRGKHAVSRVL